MAGCRERAAFLEAGRGLAFTLRRLDTFSLQQLHCRTSRWGPATADGYPCRGANSHRKPRITRFSGAGGGNGAAGCSAHHDTEPNPISNPGPAKPNAYARPGPHFHANAVSSSNPRPV